MSITLTDLKSKTPRCLSGFIVSDPNKEIISKISNDEEFVIKQISCSCGNKHLNIITTKQLNINTNNKKENDYYYAPIYLNCPSCSLENLLFNPQQHGWDGENGDSTEIIGEGNKITFNDKKGSILVEYSYQDIDSYDELVNDGIENPEDYFETFNVYFVENGSNSLVDVVNYECA